MQRRLSDSDVVEKGERLIAQQWERIQQTKRMLPYLLLSGGPTEVPCPLHQSQWGLLLPVDDPYWREAKLRSSPNCKCRIRQVGRFEYAKLILKRETDGISSMQ